MPFALLKSPFSFTRRFYSTSMSAPITSQALLDAAAYRRTYYPLANKSPIPDSKIVDIVQQSVKHAPSAFNSQSGRALVLLGPQQKQAWDIVAKHYLPGLQGAPDQLKLQEGKIAGYKGAYGSVLFFEDQDVIAASQERNPKLKDVFPYWSENSTGMLQWIVWTALELEGLRGNLQHHASYHPAVTPDLAKLFDFPSSWKVTAWLNFGEPAGEPNPKTFSPIEDRVKVVGA